MVLVLPMIKTATFSCCLWARHRLDVHVHAHAHQVCVCAHTCMYRHMYICRYPYMCKSVCISQRTISDVIPQELSNLFFWDSLPHCPETLQFSLSGLSASLESPCVHLSKNEINSMNHCTEVRLYGYMARILPNELQINLWTFYVHDP